MENEKIMYVLAAIFSMRAVYWQERAEYAASCAYRNAFDMLTYAIKGDWDCLRQFGWSDEAEELINKVGTDVDLWELADTITAQLS